MIVAFTSSSPIAGVAILGDAGEILYCRSKPSAQNASGVCLELLQDGLSSIGRSLAEATLFVADLGPGSFMGTRVSVVLAKTFAYSRKVKAAGVSAFDLISPNDVVFIPSRKGEFFVRSPGQLPVRQAGPITQAGAIGYGPDVEDPQYPNASGFSSIFAGLVPMSPEQLLPQYLMEPSITAPNRPYQHRADG